MLYSQLARKALRPAGAAATVASLGFFSEQVSSRASARVVTVAASKQSANLNRLLQQARQQQQPRALYFSSKAGAPAGETAAASDASVKVAADATAAATLAASTAAKTATSKAKGFSFLAWYEGHLNARPVFTKMCTGSILWGIGDAVAQIVPHVSASNETSASSSTPLPQLEYDWPRTGRAVFFGFVIHAPTSHVHFNFLEYITIQAGVKGLGIPVFKAFMEQFVYWSWFSNSLYHGSMGLMQGLSLEQSYQRICDVLWETQKAQWVFWIPIQLLNFRFVPVRHQLNVVLLTSVVWTALLSAWYPPATKEESTSAEALKKGVAFEAAVHD